jgi:hypothetical protein
MIQPSFKQIGFPEASTTTTPHYTQINDNDCYFGSPHYPQCTYQSTSKQPSFKQVFGGVLRKLIDKQELSFNTQQPHYTLVAVPPGCIPHPYGGWIC